MAVAPIIALGAAVVGAGVSMYGQFKQAAAERKANRLRRKQADLEAMRKKRQMLREYAMNRAKTLATAGGQGIGFGGSTAAGAQAGQSNQLASNIGGAAQGRAIGVGLDKTANDITTASLITGIGGGISSLGPAVTNYANS